MELWPGATAISCIFSSRSSDPECGRGFKTRSLLIDGSAQCVCLCACVCVCALRSVRNQPEDPSDGKRSRRKETRNIYASLFGAFTFNIHVRFQRDIGVLRGCWGLMCVWLSFPWQLSVIDMCGWVEEGKGWVCVLGGKTRVFCRIYWWIPSLNDETTHFLLKLN